MITLFHEPFFTFRFGEDRIVPRFHLEGINEGQQISIFRMNFMTNERSVLLANAIIGKEGWVDLTQPILVSVDEGFIVEVIL